MFGIGILITLALHWCLCTGAQPAEVAEGRFQLWLEDYVFRKGETDIMKDIIEQHSASYAVAGVSSNASDKGKACKGGCISWDYLLTNRAQGKKIFKTMPLKDTQVISVTPGLSVISQKSGIVRTLWSGYGGMVGVMPLSFALPDGMKKLQEYVKHARAGEEESVWVLKENKHRGQGVTPVKLKDIMGKLMTKYVEIKRKKTKTSSPYGYILAQKFIGNQMLIENIPFTFRIWTVISGGLDSIRGYVFDGSIIPFGDKEFFPEHDRDTLAQANDLVVNLFLQNRTKAKDPWSMTELKQYLLEKTGGVDAFDRIWSTVKQSTARTLAAAIPGIRKEVRRLPYYQEGNFEFLGVDFVLDSDMKPWLIEVNYLPSMARKVVGCVPKYKVDRGEKVPRSKVVCGASIFDRQKEYFIDGLLYILSRRHAAMKAHRQEAESAVAGSRNPECHIGVDVLAKTLDMLFERRNAIEKGFSPLTEEIYESLHCLGAANAETCLETGYSLKTQKVTAARDLILRAISWIQDGIKRLPTVPYSSHTTFRPEDAVEEQPFEPSHIDEILYALLREKENLRSSMSAERLLEKMCSIDVDLKRKNIKSEL
ncbi:hypothetical protein M9434_002182 [Picochlorum sp. BPE23]|nr:hypothetical protein M9434_002182 [Picochlorum sp. BPE23]